jgi:hypothetical protein
MQWGNSLFNSLSTRIYNDFFGLTYKNKEFVKVVSQLAIFIFIPKWKIDRRIVKIYTH